MNKSNPRQPIIIFLMIVAISLFFLFTDVAVAAPPLEFSTAGEFPDRQSSLDDEAKCVVMLLNEAAGNRPGYEQGVKYCSEQPHLSIPNTPLGGIDTHLSVYWGLPAMFRLEFEDYCPGSGDRSCDGGLKSNQPYYDYYYFLKVGDWEFFVQESMTSWESNIPMPDSGDEAMLVMQAAKKYWDMYQQYGRCDGVQDVQPQDNYEQPYIDPQDDPNNFQPDPYIDPADDPDNMDACLRTSCWDPACSPDGSEAWYNPVCIDGTCDYSNSPVDTCQYGCEDGIGCLDEYFDEWCSEYMAENCGPYCENDWLYKATGCDAEGFCTYEGEYCANGCANAHCIQSTYVDDGFDFEDLLPILAIGGGITVLGGGAIGGGYLGYKLLKARKAVKASSAVPTPKADKSLLNFDNAKRLIDYPNKITSVLEKLKFAPEAKQDWLRARNFMHQMPSELSTQEYIEASKRRMNPTGKAGKYLDRAGKVFDAVDAVFKAEDVIKARGYTGWEKAGAYYVEGTNKVLTTILTKNPIVSVVDQVAGDLTGHNIENTIRAGEEKWHKVTKEYSRNIFDVDAKDAVINTKEQGIRYIKNLKRMKKARKIDPAEARRRAKIIFDKMVR